MDVSFREPATCAWCKWGKDPKPGKFICGKCVKQFDRILCSHRYQKLRREFLQYYPQCRQCLRSRFTTALTLESGESIAFRDVMYVDNSTLLGVYEFTTKVDNGQVEMRLGEFVSRTLLDSIQRCPVIESKLMVQFHIGSIQPAPVATILDHVKPWRRFPQLFYVETNWQPLCMDCHNAKINTEEGGAFRQRKFRAT